MSSEAHQRDNREAPLGIDPDSRQTLEVDRVVDAARQRLLRQPHLTVQRIWCDFDGTTLFLRGQVPRFYHKQLAQAAVAGLEGVSHVVNEIEVVW
jgi:osmotically-inducible protein OsmY